LQLLLLLYVCVLLASLLEQLRLKWSYEFGECVGALLLCAVPHPAHLVVQLRLLTPGQYASL
jgi:hypothetical protein